MTHLDILFDEERLLQLVTNLYVLTGITANILDPQGVDIHLFKDHPPFCRAINELPEGHQRCIRCDMWKVKNYSAEKGFQFYRCHAGICEAVMPLYDKKQPLAYLVFGCFLDDTSMEEQWERTRPRLDWWPGGADQLRDAFFQFRQYSRQQLLAYSETLEAGQLAALYTTGGVGRSVAEQMAQTTPPPRSARRPPTSPGASPPAPGIWPSWRPSWPMTGCTRSPSTAPSSWSPPRIPMASYFS